MIRKQIIPACLVYLLMVSQAFPCTIISGKTKDGVVWVGNNEDWSFDFNTMMNVLPREEKLLGAITFTYDQPDTFIQGGVNEQGLFFDINAVPAVPVSEYEGWNSKKDFPGGDNAFLEYILRYCSTVVEVLDLFKQYRAPGVLLDGQMHLADRQGNLAVVNAVGVKLTQSNYQVTTNFNVCAQSESAEGKVCWRFPIAERMLKQRGVSFENFRDILDATQQRVGSTIYGDVLNLTTGDVYLYYAGDFQNPFHFKIQDILSKGKQSYLMRSLFPEAPVVKVWNTYQAAGTEAALQLFRQMRGSVPEKRRPEILRHIFITILYGTSLLQTQHHYAAAEAFFNEWEKETKGQSSAANLYGAFVQLSHGNYQKAQALLAGQLKIEALEAIEWRPRVEALLARLEGKRPNGANIGFELKGHQAAKFVALVLPDKAHIYTPLLRTADGWAGDFAMPSGKVHYAFMVDGRIVLDPANSNSEVYTAEDGSGRLNIKVVK